MLLEIGYGRKKQFIVRKIILFIKHLYYGQTNLQTSQNISYLKVLPSIVNIYMFIRSGKNIKENNKNMI